MTPAIIPKRFLSISIALLHDTFMVPVAWFLSYWLRLETINPVIFSSATMGLAIILPVQLFSFILFGLYRGVWRFASLPDLLRIIKAVAAGTFISLVLIFLFTRAEGLPRSVPVIYTLLLIMLLSGPRLL